jgi:hypothetical protein
MNKLFGQERGEWCFKTKTNLRSKFLYFILGFLVVMGFDNSIIFFKIHLIKVHKSKGRSLIVVYV